MVHNAAFGRARDGSREPRRTALCPVGILHVLSSVALGRWRGVLVVACVSLSRRLARDRGDLATGSRPGSTQPPYSTRPSQ
jgi:hypothetical protein